MNIQKIGVVGAGQMGGGIAQVCARAGFEVLLQDIHEPALRGGLENIGRNLERDAAKGRLTAAEKGEAFDRITGVTDLEELRAADLVVEAAPEKMDLKKDLFGRLDRICRPGTILASNTSSCPITALAAATARPAQVIGMHFMNPVPVMKLVEIICGLETAEETFAAVRDLAVRLGKEPVAVRDFPGFVSNRVLMPMINEAVFCLMEGVAAAEAVDSVMKLGMNHPMGPLALADMIGLDTCLSILEVLYDGFKDPKYRPCPLLVQYVRAGRLGRKSGRGFYEYGHNER